MVIYDTQLNMQHTGVKPTMPPEVIEEIDKQEVDISEAIKMMNFKLGTKKDELPEVKRAKIICNLMVNDFEIRLLRKLYTGDKCHASSVWGLWTMFQDGLETQKMRSRFESVNISEEEFDNCVKMLRQTIDGWKECGSLTMQHIFYTAKLYFDCFSAKLKLESIYVGDDPVIWYQNEAAHKESVLARMEQRWSSEDRREASKKLQIIMTVRVNVDN